MKTKQEIVENWLPRYTDRKLEDFSEYILLTNFTKYVELFADHFKVPILGLRNSMPNARRRNYDYQLWNGKFKCCDDHGSIVGCDA